MSFYYRRNIMSKSEDKKQFIVDNAIEVFKEKGFKDVTMKDIIDRCNISRGGIYLYFKNTQEIFEEVIKKEENNDKSLLLISQNLSNLDIIKYFLEEVKKELLNKNNNLIVATYEYIFYKFNNKENLNLSKKYSIAYETLYKIIQNGIKNKEFKVEINKTINHIIFLLEGLRISSLVIPLNEKIIDEQIENILRDFKIEK
ncbi:TetR/AcrR family transcriptional regulator [Anaerofustis stercorihominis]|uniref:TetR/AcrR family transcriptional regulator n=1 Tax=Anaerofustis stercorihominis TaxID=214853 RepID=UPI0018DDBB53|nr:TetR/AcrR family transcriptional regulator [Anaerofustis stercorihominis]